VPPQDAVRVLLIRALGIGENHERPDGRHLALRLLASTTPIVRHLFVELPPWGQNIVQRAGVRASTSREQTGVEKGLEFGQRHQCVIPLKRVISAALLERIPVHCVDHRLGGAGGHMTTRNRTIANNFLQITNGTGTRGCLLLFGGAHFDGADGEEGEETLSQLIPHMDWIRCG